jgi:hypothetical protein
MFSIINYEHGHVVGFLIVQISHRVESHKSRLYRAISQNHPPDIAARPHSANPEMKMAATCHVGRTNLSVRVSSP